MQLYTRMEEDFLILKKNDIKNFQNGKFKPKYEKIQMVVKSI